MHLQITARHRLDTLFQCYFLLSAPPSVPIIYLVERLREGKSYTAQSVKAVQEVGNRSAYKKCDDSNFGQGRLVFILLCSFQRPEPWQPSQQWAIPQVPGPDDCELDEDVWRKLATQDNLSPQRKRHLLEYAAVRALFSNALDL
jgi:acyl-CoA thioesterase